MEMTMINTINIPGLTFRRLEREQDWIDLTYVYNAAAQADSRPFAETVDSLRAYLSPSDHFNPQEDLLVADLNGTAIGYSKADWFIVIGQERVYFTMGFLHPNHRRQGIGSAMLRHTEERLRQIAAAHPDDLPKRFGSYVFETEVGKTALLIREGYQSVSNEVSMVRPNLDNIPDVPLAPGIEVRPVQPDHLRAIFEADDEAMSDDNMHAAATESDYQRFLTDPFTFQPHLWCVAWDGDQVVGQVRSYIPHAENTVYGRQRGYTEFISVRRPWRRKGIARALLARSLAILKEQGMTEAALGTERENPSGAYALYESMGFRTVAISHFYRKPLTANQQETD